MAAHAQVVFDAMLSHAKGVQQIVDQAREAGRAVRIVYVYRGPVDSYRSALERAWDEGRIPPIDYFIESHQGAGQTVRFLAKHYAGDPSVEIAIIDNTGARGKSKLSTIAATPTPDYTGLSGKLHELLESEHAAGRVTEAVYEQARIPEADSEAADRLVRPGGGGRPQQPGGESASEGSSDAGSEPDGVNPKDPGPGSLQSRAIDTAHIPETGEGSLQSRALPGDQSLFSNDEEDASRTSAKSHEDKLLGDRLTAPMKSGMAARPAKIKPAKNRGLFDEEKPAQTTCLFFRARASSPASPRPSRALA